MRDVIDHVLLRTGGAAPRHALVAAIGRTAFDAEVRAAWLVAPAPRAYCRPWDSDQPDVRRRAALVSVGPPAVLSHLTTLESLGLVAPGSGDPRIHITVPATRSLGQASIIIVHRTRRLPSTRRVAGLPTVAPATAIVSCWPARERDARRDAALASTGWLTLRFSYARLHSDIDGCRRETLAALARRRP